MGRRMSWLQRRGAVYRFRRAVPARLRPILGGKHEVVRPLNTKDIREAERRAIPIAAEVDRMFAEAEAALKNPAVRVYKAVQQDTVERTARPRTDDEREAEVSAVADALERLEGNRGAEAATQRAILEAILERLNGSATDHPDNPPLSVVFERWKVERKPPEKTWTECEGVRRDFTASIGGDLPVRAGRKRHGRAFKELLLTTPSPRTGRPRSPETARKLLGLLSAVLTWTRRQGYIDANPAQDVAQIAAKSDPDAGRLPYDRHDLKTLFSVCREDGPNHWLPLLALFTGARLRELGQLHVADVREEDGVHYLALEGGEGKRFKNKSSRRRMPLHPELIRLGFLQYVEAQRKAGHTRLFHQLRGTRFGLTDEWSKYWGKHARQLGITDSRKVFHSFRHGFKDACRAAVNDEEVRDYLTGHSNGSVGRKYGTGVPLKVLTKAIAKIRYPGLTLTSLRRP